MESIITSKKLVETYVGWVPPQIMESRVEDRLMRRQEIIGPNRFTILIRHTSVTTQHLCGYVHVDAALMADLVQFNKNDWLNYWGPGTRDISWRWFNGSRKLVTAAKVSHGDQQDYWVGTDFRSVGNDEGAIELLNSIERIVDAARKIRS